jgi:hypothetical protein
MADLSDMEAEDPVGFAKEMQGDPSSGSMETILRKDFMRWDMVGGEAVLYNDRGEVGSRWSLKDCRAGIGIDLAWEEDQVADYCAFVRWGANGAQRLFLILQWVGVFLEWSDG